MLLFLLALLVAVVVGGLANSALARQSDLVRIAGTVAGAVIGYLLTYAVANNI